MQLTTIQLISQLIGLSAIVFLAQCYITHSKKVFFVNQILTNVVIVLSYAIVGNILAMAFALLSILRSSVFYSYHTRQVQTNKWWIYAFLGLTVASSIAFYNGPIGILNAVGTIILILALTLKNIKHLKLVLIAPITMFIIYNIVIGSYSIALLNIMELVILLVTVFTKYLHKHHHVPFYLHHHNAHHKIHTHKHHKKKTVHKRKSSATPAKKPSKKDSF